VLLLLLLLLLLLVLLLLVLLLQERHAHAHTRAVVAALDVVPTMLILCIATDNNRLARVPDPPHTHPAVAKARAYGCNCRGCGEERVPCLIDSCVPIAVGRPQQQQQTVVQQEAGAVGQTGLCC
jgi:hypothetical protein